VGIEGSMNATGKIAVIAAIAVALSLSLPGIFESANATTKSKARTKFTVHPKNTVRSKRGGRGYGFLPGYRQPPDLTDWRTPRRAAGPEVRYWSPYDGELRYGWGWPGYYRGRWNGGSFGPCWTSTPIGMMPTCGQ
jgi:hypothetical protein